MMTHKDFVVIANVLRETAAGDAIIEGFVDALRGENPRFDRERFIGACKGEYVTGRDKVR